MATKTTTTNTSRAACGKEQEPRYFWDRSENKLWRTNPDHTVSFYDDNRWIKSSILIVDDLVVCRDMDETPYQRVCAACGHPVVAVGSARYVHGTPADHQDQSGWDHAALSEV